MALAEATVKSRREGLRIAQLRLDAGVTSALDYRQSETLLTQAGFTVVEPENPHLCCGSAGTYNLLQPDLSAELKRRKLATLNATGPDIIAAGNIGCMIQIGSGTDIPVIHTVELLDWATGGPKPRGLETAPH